MFRLRVCAVVCVLLTGCVLPVSAQQPAVNGSVVPSMVKFTGAVTDLSHKPLTGTVGVTFSLYKDAEGGAPLWMETQSVQADRAGHYSVMLGSTSTHGLPSDLFISGEARWLGVRTEGQAEQPRTLLLSVPYALKAADAQTLGGLPPSAYMLAAPLDGNAASQAIAGTATSAIPATAPPPVTGVGAADFVPLWLDSIGTLGNSALFQTGSGTTAKVGINTTTPANTLDVKGGETVRGNLSLPATGNATPTAGKPSQPATLAASAFNSSTHAAVTQNFRWQAEPSGNNTANPSGTLNLLYGSGSNTIRETGLKIGGGGKITFAKGQTFPGTDAVRSVALSAPATDFTVSGSPVTTSGTLGLSWNIAPTASNTANAIVKRDGLGNIAVATVFATNFSGGAGLYGTGTWGVWGTGDAGGGVGVEGDGHIGVYGAATRGGTAVYGVYGSSDAGGTGVYGEGRNGVQGLGLNGGTGVYGSGALGVEGVAGTGGYGVYALNTGTGDALVAENQSGGFAGYFLGDVFVNGTLSKSGGSFKIDHPLDPANKYLSHSFVESPDMMNIYNGNVITDEQGNSVVSLPEWFETLNRDFRYQLTVMGQFAQAIVASKVANHGFAIKTDKPNVEVSWQVTGIRHDAWANAHRIPVEQLKPQQERGFYLTPELFGASKQKSIARAHHPEMEKLAEQKRMQPPSAAHH